MGIIIFKTTQEKEKDMGLIVFTLAIGAVQASNRDLEAIHQTAAQEAIQGIIDQIYASYDVDMSGALGKEETKKFMVHSIGNLNGFSHEAFDQVFTDFDRDGSGAIDKSEMSIFIKQL